MQRGIVERREGDAAGAIATQREVMALLDPAAEPFLFLSAISNLALALCDADRFAEAAGVIAAHEELYRHQESPRTLVKESVLRGRVAHGLGQVDRAECLFRDARDRAMEQRDFFSASLASLDLATLFLEQGRSHELREVAALLGPVFEAHDLRQEATAALLLFTRAALSDEITVEMVRRLRWKLEVGGRAGAQAAVS
jgi:ATP/maltotriose-dependent transcriptional regulator MalT